MGHMILISQSHENVQQLYKKMASKLKFTAFDIVTLLTLLTLLLNIVLFMISNNHNYKCSLIIAHRNEGKLEICWTQFCTFTLCLCS